MADKTVSNKDFLNKDYVDSEGKTKVYPKTGQGLAYPASDKDLKRDELGFTHPNLHRRIDPKPILEAKDKRNKEYKEKEYKLNIMNVHSYRTTIPTVHDEETEIDEIP